MTGPVLFLAAVLLFMGVRSDDDVNTATVTATSAVSTSQCTGGTSYRANDQLPLILGPLYLNDNGATYCSASLRVCKNTQAPATSGTCTYLGGLAPVSSGQTLSFAFEGQLATTDVTCPGSCVISVRVDTFLNGVLTQGTHTADTTLSYTGSGSSSTTIVATGGDGNTYSVPVTANIVCGDDEGENEENEEENENETAKK